ncbi:hypothetical protein CerSpe_130260 [Prunus speciosa]
MTPADVAEHLMPKSLTGVAESCLHNLIQALEQEIENGKLKAEEEGKEKKSAAEEKDQDTEASSDRK